MQAIWQEKMDRRLPIHPSIQRIMNRRVFLRDHLQDGWDAFWRLSTSRQQGFALGHIQVSEIAAYIMLYDYVPGSYETEELVWIVQILDDEYLKWKAEKAEEAKSKPKEQAGGRNRAAGKR